MGALKEVVRAIIAIIAAIALFYFWDQVRANDPEVYKYGAAIVTGLLFFLILHFIGKGES